MFFSVLHRLSLGYRSVKWLENPQLEAEGKNPFSLDSNEPGQCILTGKPSAGRVIFALNY